MISGPTGSASSENFLHADLDLVGARMRSAATITRSWKVETTFGSTKVPDCVEERLFIDH